MAPSRGRILIVDDEANARAALSEILHDEGYVTETAADGFKALGKIDEFAPDVVLTDLKMPGLDGIALMEKVKAASPLTVFVVMTAFGTITSAVAAMKNGADNYLTKPLDYEALSAVVERAMEKARLLQETRQLRDRLRDRNAFKHIITDDPKMKALLDVVAQVGPSKACVLVSGESGTGKELIAAALHEHSPRAKGPFLALDCGALPAGMITNELFGHRRGAYTNAVESANILKPAGIERVLLVTHAWHIPRARLAFEHAGLQVIPAPTGFVTPDLPEPEDFLPRPSALLNSYYFFHEVIGYAAYVVRTRW